MLQEADLRVVSTSHATDQALRRVRDLRGGSRWAASGWVERTTLEGLRAGRKARNFPRWCVAESWVQYRPRLRQEGTWRYVWDEAESAVMLCHYTRDKAGAGSIWLIITVMTPRRPVAEVA